MQTVLIVFLLASAASFFPIYWLLSSLAARRLPAKHKRSPATSAKSRFIICLRAEAIDRVKHLMAEMNADAEARQSAAAGGSQSAAVELVARAAEARGMIAALFSRETLAAFDELVGRFERPITDRRSVTDQIAFVEQCMTAAVVTGSRSSKQRLSLLPRLLITAPRAASARATQ